MLKTNLIIRKATSKDVEGCQNIDSQMGFNTLQTIFDEAVKSHRLFVAIENGSVVGYLRYGYIWDGEVAYIQMIRVHKTHQKKGVGRELVQTLERNLKETNVFLVLSSTDESNKNSYKFHIALGFQACGQLAINKDQQQEIFFKKKLS